MCSARGGLVTSFSLSRAGDRLPHRRVLHRPECPPHRAVVWTEAAPHLEDVDREVCVSEALPRLVLPSGQHTSTQLLLIRAQTKPPPPPALDCRCHCRAQGRWAVHAVVVAATVCGPYSPPAIVVWRREKGPPLGESGIGRARRLGPESEFKGSRG